MIPTPLARAIAFATASTCLTLPTLAQAEFIKDSKASLELRNFYMNRDFRQDGAAQSKREEWAQGFLLRYESGFTEGTVGVGVDAIGLLGVKLDSSADRAGTGLLKRDQDGDKAAQDEYGEFGATAKLRVSQTVLRAGTLLPKLPVVSYNDSRLLPQTFQGGWVNSTDIAGLTLDGGQLQQVNERDSSDYQDMVVNTLSKKNIRFSGDPQSDEFNFAGGSYKWNDSLSTGYHYGNLEGLYNQHILSLVHQLPIADKQSLKTDLRFARSTDDGDSNIDNKAFGALFTYAMGFHSFGLGYQKMSGDTGYAYLSDSDPFLVNYVQINDFANKDEKSWQVRYDYNFAGLGIPGLTFMTRYIRGSDIDQLNPALSDASEWERDTDIAYVIQDGPLKNLGIKWRNATVRNDIVGGSDLDENRLILSYTLPLW